MGENAQFRPTQTRGVDNAGMNEFINDDDIILVEEGADRAQGGR